MTPFSDPGAVAKPPAATPRAPTPAGAPRPMRGSYGNLAGAVRVAPSPTPRAQAPGIPIARPRVPMAPHPQGALTAGAPRPTVNLGGAPMPAATPTPRMQAPPQPGRAPGLPPNTRGVGAAVPSARPHVPLVQPTQRTPAVAPSLGKREATTMGPAPIQQAKRHAPMPRPQGAPTGGVPLPTNPAVGARAPVQPAHAQGAPTAGNATPPRPPSPPQLPIFGVYNDPSKGWMARVMDPKRRVARDIGPFDTVHLAALAHDRVAVAYAGRGLGPRARLNFETAFYRVETAFLQRWEGDVCEAVEKGEYEKTYAKFLKAGYKAALKVKPADGGGDEGGEKISDGDEGDELIASCYDAESFWDTIEDFFLNRPVEIGAMALREGGELLRNRFVEMHRNKSLCPVWRRDDRMAKFKTMALQKQQHEQNQMQQQHTQMQQQQQIQMQQQQIQTQQQQQRQQIQMQPQQQQQQQIQMQQQRQQQFRHQQMMMIQKQRQQQMMMAQQEQQYPDDDAMLQVKQELI